MVYELFAAGALPSRRADALLMSVLALHRA
jgi:hypothetical protein